eukprot:272366-Chlamydomonas_euryale.AAC.3
MDTSAAMVGWAPTQNGVACGGMQHRMRATGHRAAPSGRNASASERQPKTWERGGGAEEGGGGGRPLPSGRSCWVGRQQQERFWWHGG